ncbi:unnamed protein product [Symbiodinium natans]|uniref:Uncharacterized protein n=1 Tax=Symbiodinium natans TaxID=878477 RepID=A0A812ICY4_9DINO|nr:unnamed protein product [Symbiodinium natans]
MAASLLEAVEDGSLEAFLTSGQDLQVQEALQDTTSTALTGLPSDMQYTGIVDMANQTAKSHMAAPRRAAVVQRDRQLIGGCAAGTAFDREAERSVMERLAETNSLEVALAEAQGKLRMLTQDAEHRKKLLEAEELRTLRLQDSHRQLVDELDFACLKLGVKQLQLDMSSNAQAIPEVTPNLLA